MNIFVKTTLVEPGHLLYVASIDLIQVVIDVSTSDQSSKRMQPSAQLTYGSRETHCTVMWSSDARSAR